jgi:Tfp pilus assembly protein PilE
VVKRLLLRLRGEDGFGLIELSMAMVMLNVGILAVVAAFNSGAVALRRSSLVANATVVADQQMEAFRRMRNCEIGLQSQSMPSSTSSYAADTTAFAAAGSYYSSSTAAASQLWVTDYLPTSGQSTYVTTWESNHSPVSSSRDTTSLTGAATPNCVNGSGSAVNPHQTSVVGPDNRTYIVDTYIYVVQVASQGWQKQVTIVVRDPNDPTHSLFRESSTFDPADSP